MKGKLRPPTFTLFSRASGGFSDNVTSDDDCGIASLILVVIIAIAGLLGISFVSAFSWKPILAVFAAGIVAMAFAGVLFFKADFKFVMLAIASAVGIVFILEVSFPVIIGGVVILAAVWNLKLLTKKPILLGALVLLGLAMMLLVKLSIMGV